VLSGGGFRVAEVDQIRKDSWTRQRRRARDRDIKEMVIGEVVVG
jgi:hypothetical protein